MVTCSNRSVTGFTFCTHIQVSFVIECHEAGKFIHANPWNWLVLIHIGFQILYRGTVLPDLSMTGHAGFARRDGNDLTRRSQLVTVRTSEVGRFRVLLVTKRYGLPDCRCGRLILCSKH
jgi:hypothetical protein